jgi:PTH2 family peptidyl-tRNA hydrolase
MGSKQVIIIRSDLRSISGHKLRSGKIIAQGAHASLKVLLDMMNASDNSLTLDIEDGSPLKDWLDGIYTKVCLSVDSEEELVGIYETAKAMNIPCSIITDIGLTEFDGVPTKTSVAIGPYWSEEIDLITGKLKLL